MKCPKGINHSDSRKTSGFLGLRGLGKIGRRAKGYWASFEGDENVLKMW